MKRRFVGVVGVLVAFVGLAAMPVQGEEIDIQVSPSTINLATQGTWVTVHAEIPYAGVVAASLTLNGVEIAWTKADNRGELVAKFNVDSVREIVAPPSATLELVGVVETAEGAEIPFSGTDTINVVQPEPKGGR